MKHDDTDELGNAAPGRVAAGSCRGAQARRRGRQAALLGGLGRCAAGVLLAVAALPQLSASEDVPYRPFAYWADVPDPGQFVLGLVYDRSEAYHIWAKRDFHNITVHAGGESYGIDNNQGFLALQYGIAKRWAADLNIGVTTVGWRKFDPNEGVQSTTGLMDWTLGVRYQIFNETNTDAAWLPASWLPTLSFRAGGVLPGSYNQHLVFAPGLRSAGIEPQLLLRKHVGWPGLGVYADALYRWNHTTANDQYIAAAGLFQQIRRWELDVGYRHLQTISGGDISYDPADPASIVYPRNVREISDGIEAGFSYTTRKRHIRIGFQSLVVVDGSNTDQQFWLGGSIDFPFGGRHD